MVIDQAGRAALIGIATVALSAVFAALAPGRVVGGTHELASFALWSLPLGFALAIFARRARFMRLPPYARALAAAGFGLLTGFFMTVLGWGLLGGWMLAWDFPVLYCWTLAAVFGAVIAARGAGAIRFAHTPLGVGAALVPLGALAWVGARSIPAVLITYQSDPSGRGAQDVYDSVLTATISTPNGRTARWPYSHYRLIRTADGHTAALVGLRRAHDRDSIRQALTSYPFVRSVTDTVIPR